MNLKFLKKSDAILIVVLLLIGVACLLPKYLKNEPTVAVIYNNGVEIERIDLDSVTEKYSIDLDCTPKATITVEKGVIYYSYAECHDKLCMNTGKLTRAGDTAACLPSKTLVVLEGIKEEGAPDVITY